MTDKPTTGNGNQDAKGRFAKGNKASPGRTKGSRNKATEAALQLLNGEAEALARKAVEMALEGDTTALRLCLERLVSPCKERALPPLELPTVTTASDLPKVTAAIMEAVSNGEFLPSQASSLAQLISAHAKNLELQDLEQRIALLEAKQNRGTP